MPPAGQRRLHWQRPARDGARAIIPAACLLGVLLVAAQAGPAQVAERIKDVLTQMREHGSTARVQEEGCVALGGLAFNTDISVKIAVAGGIDDVLAAMRKHKSIARVQEECVVALWLLAVNPDHKVKIADAGGIADVLAAMRRHKSTARVQERGCGVLRNLAVNPDNAVKIANAGGVDSVLAAMRKYKSNAGLQEEGCGVLRNLAHSADNSVKIAVARGIADVLAAMREHKSTAELQLEGCGVLHILAQDADNSVEIADAGGIDDVLAAMRAHRSHAGMQEWGCGALSNLALQHIGNQITQDADNPVKIADAGGIADVLVAMRTHRSHAGVQVQSCGALSNLALNANNNAKIADAGGIADVLAAMRAHGSHAGVQDWGCNALSILARTDSKVKIVAAGGIADVLAAMRAHRSHAGVQLQSCSALSILALGTDIKVKIADAGGIADVLAAMRAHRSHAEVQDWGCSALSMFSRTNSNVKIVDAGGIADVLAAMRAHRLHAEVQQGGCDVLVGLALNTDYNVKIVDAGGIADVLVAMRTHRSHPGVQMQSCGALSNLALNANNNVKIADAAGITDVLEAMRAHRSIAEVQEECCYALRILAFVDGNRIKIVAAGGIADIQEAIRCHWCHPFVQLRGWLALYSLDCNAAMYAVARLLATVLAIWVCRQLIAKQECREALVRCLRRHVWDRMQPAANADAQRITAAAQEEARRMEAAEDSKKEARAGKIRRKATLRKKTQEAERKEKEEQEEQEQTKTAVAKRMDEEAKCAEAKRMVAQEGASQRKAEAQASFKSLPRKQAAGWCVNVAVGAGTSSVPTAVPAPAVPALAPRGSPVARFKFADLLVATGNFEKQLGSGGSGSVFHGTLKSSATKIAVKKLEFAAGSDVQGALIHMQTEIEVLSQVCHPNMIPLLGWSDDGEAPCLVYALAAGGSLQDRLACRENAVPLTARERILVLSDVARGLAYLHAQVRVVHRDVKSANVLIDNGCVGRIGDFGIARSVRDTCGVTATLLQTQAPMGTTIYMSPECMLGDLSYKVDAFAFGLRRSLACPSSTPRQTAVTCAPCLKKTWKRLRSSSSTSTQKHSGIRTRRCISPCCTGSLKGAWNPGRNAALR